MESAPKKAIAAKKNITTTKSQPSKDGFSLTEVLITVSIIGTLSAIAVPSYQNQYKRSCQIQSENTINALMATSQAYNDEFGTPATSWEDLDRIGTLMTKDGPATSSDFSAIPLAACNYWLEVSHNGNDYIFSAARKNLEPIEPSQTDNLNVYGCLNVATGASDIALGDGDQPASTGDLSCN